MFVLDHLRHDLRFALRQLRKTLAFTITAILVLALGLCASITIFAFVDAALLKPLPHHEPARLTGKTWTQVCYSCPLTVRALQVKLRRGASHVSIPRIP